MAGRISFARRHAALLSSRNRAGLKETGRGLARPLPAHAGTGYATDEAQSATGVEAGVEDASALDPAQYQWEYKRYRKVIEEQQGVPNHREFRLY